MPSKIVRTIRKNVVEPFVMRQFSLVERGERDYEMRSFADDEEFSVQDAYAAANAEEPATIEIEEDEITDKDYLPPSKLAKAENGLVGERVEMPKGSPYENGFVESELFSDSEESEKRLHEHIRRSHISERHSEEREKEIAGLKGDKAALEERIKKLEEENKSLAAMVAEKDAAISAKIKEIESINAGLPEKLKAAKAEGDAEGYKRGEQDFTKKYEADKNDYITHLNAFNKNAAAKLNEISSAVNSIDDNIIETVLGFIKAIVGAERRFNDNFVANLIKNNLNRLNELKDVRFSVNPDDLEAVKRELPNYVVSTDTSVAKGCVNVHTRIGEVSLDSDNMIADLEKQINEELGVSKVS